METKSKTSGLRKTRRFFGWLLLISVLVLIASTMLFSNSPHKQLTAANPNLQRYDKSGLRIRPAITASNTKEVVSIGSLITSGTSLIGFIITNIIALRKEKRDSEAAKREKRKNDELDNLRAEVDELKQNLNARKA